jgi:hypothetical protein
MLNALPVSRPISTARSSTVARLADTGTQSLAAARFNRDRSESNFQFDIWLSTAVTASASSATMHLRSAPSGA